LRDVQRLVSGERSDRLDGDAGFGMAVYMPTRPLCPLYFAAAALAASRVYPQVSR
jgi:hypothetical protein